MRPATSGHALYLEGSCAGGHANCTGHARHQASIPAAADSRLRVDLHRGLMVDRGQVSGLSFEVESQHHGIMQLLPGLGVRALGHALRCGRHVRRRSAGHHTHARDERPRQRARAAARAGAAGSEAGAPGPGAAAPAAGTARRPHPMGPAAGRRAQRRATSARTRCSCCGPAPAGAARWPPPAPQAARTARAPSGPGLEGLPGGSARAEAQV